MTLHIEDHLQYESAIEYAESIGLRQELEKQLAFLDTFAEGKDRGLTRCRLFMCYGPNSFAFIMEHRGADGNYCEWFHGALIFHDPEYRSQGGWCTAVPFPLVPSRGWAIHT